MENIESIDYTISDNSTDQNFTIIYKGKERSECSQSETLLEIKTSKNELISKLGYFRQKNNEIQSTNELYIHDNFHVDVFQDFINSITTKHIKIDQRNCQELFELGIKYDYKEIQEKAQDFIQKRPDLKNIIDNFLNQNSNDDQFDGNLLKEEIVSKNLDVCLKNGFLDRIPLKILIRILNSPHRIIHDHQQLFQFVIQKMKSCDKIDKDIIEMLPSCLDYTKMSKEEIEELFKNMNFSNFFRPQKEDVLIKSIFHQLNEVEKKNSSFEEKISDLYTKYSELMKCDVKNENIYLDLNNKIEQQSIIIEKQEKMIQNLKSSNEKYEIKLNEMKVKLDHFEEKNKKFENEINSINDIKEKINSQNTKIQAHQNFIQNLQSKNEVQKRKGIMIPVSNNLYGIFNYLQTHSSINNEVNITFSSNFYQDKLHLVLQIDSTTENFQSNHEPNSYPWICFEFTKHKIIPSNYTIRSSKTSYTNYYFPRSWVIEGSNNKSSWTNLDQQNDCTFIKGSNLVHTFQIQNQNQNEYKYIKMRLTSPSWGEYSDNCRLLFASIEFYGELI